MKIIFWGTPNYAIPSLNALIKNGHDILAVVTQPDRRRNRGSKTDFSPIKERALEENIPVYTPQNIKKDIDVQKDIFSLNADIYIVVAYGQILPKEVLENPIYGCWNSHGSILPKWRGAAPIQWCLMSGDKTSGVAIMHMEEGLDTGPILFQEEITISPFENAEQLTHKLSQLSSKLIIKAIQAIETIGPISIDQRIKKLNMKEQSEFVEQVSYARLLKKSDYSINWECSSLEIHRKVMGLYPNAFTHWKGKRIKILETEPFENINDNNSHSEILESIIKSKIKYKDGEVIYFSNKSGIFVFTCSGILLIKQAQIEGKRKASFQSLIQQMNINKGDHFTRIL